MVCICVSAPPDAPGDHNALLKFVPEMPNSPAKPPTGAGVRPQLSHGTPTQSHRTPRFNVRFEVALKSSLKNPLASFWCQARRLGYGIHTGFLPSATPKPCVTDATD